MGDGTVEYTDPTIDPTTGESIDGNAGGGYIGASNLGILAPYHQKLIDGLYAGGRIHYQ